MTLATRSAPPLGAREACPDVELFVRLADGRLAGAEAELIDRHVDACEACFELLATLARASGRTLAESGDDDAVRGLRAGDRAGRYVVSELIGRGGMGLVYAAWDPVLRRSVALKLVRPPDGARTAATRREQLLREAQALARLSHPNVVPIHDVGTAGEQLWVVMELVDGVTLRAWARAHPNASWREKLALLDPCGRALAAAHAAGIVHRDFKPDNVMIGRAPTSVRVMDFGLARVGADPQESDPARSASAVARDTLATRGVVGTPAYMAPEQHGGAQVDARADQFAFAVTAIELLWGERPFPGDSVEEIAAATVLGRVREPSTADVPRRLHRVLVRALAVDPAERWPDMGALLDELARDPTRLHRRLQIAGVLAVVVLGALGVRAFEQRAASLQCRADAEAMLAVDGAPADERLARALGDDELAVRTRERTHAWSDAWLDAETGGCRADLDGDDRDPAAAPERRTCLRAGAAALRSAVTVIAEGDASVRARALEILDELPEPTECARGRMVLPRDPETLAAVTELRERLARTGVLHSAGRDRDALALALAVLGDARVLGDEPALARALETVGGLQERVGEFAEAEESLAEAYWVAGGSGTDEIAALAAAGIAQLIAAHLSRPTDAHTWLHHAEMMLARQTEPRPSDRAAVLAAAASVAGYDGDYDAALARYREAQDLLAAVDGADAPSVGAMAANLGVISYELGHFDEALAYLDRALAIHTAAWGPTHPGVARDRLLRANALLLAGRVADAEVEARAADELAEQAIGPEHPDRIAYYNARGAIANTLGQTDVALRWHELELDLQRRSFGRDHPDEGIALDNIGNVLDTAGRHEEAIVRFREAIAVFRAALGDEHDKVAWAMHDLALAEHGAGRHAEAIAHYREAFGIWERALGRDHVMLGRGRMNLGNVLLDHGDHDAAIDELRRSAEILARGLGPDHASTAIALSRLGLTLQRLGRDAEAIAPLERALALREAGTERERVAELRFGLAQAVWRAQHDRERASALASAARDVYRELAMPDEVATIERFLAGPE